MNRCVLNQDAIGFFVISYFIILTLTISKTRRRMTSVAALSATLNNIQIDLYRYILLPFIGFGTIGNLLNLIVFLQPYLRSNPCSIYLIAYTIASICWIDFIGLTASLGVGFSLNFGTLSTVTCRIRTYILCLIINLLPDFLILAALDRTLICTRNLTIRQFSTRKVAYYSICIVTLFWIIFNIPTLFYTDIARVITGRIVCIPLPGNDFNNLIFVFYAFSNGLLPPLILILLGCITLTKLIHSINIILPVTELHQFRLSTKERQLIIMILAHILVTVILQIPSAIYQIYAVVTVNYNKSLERQVIELFIYNTSNLLLVLPACVSFYVYFITTKTFRNELRNIFK